jgi:hypothetical protein
MLSTHLKTRRRMSNKASIVVSFDDFVDSLELEPKIDFESYSEQLGVLYTNYARMDMDNITKPASRYNLKNFILKYGKADFRYYVLNQFIESCYDMFVKNREETLYDWYSHYIEIENLKSGMNFQVIPCKLKNVFDGTINLDTSRILRNINYKNMYSTKRLHKNDFQDCVSILKCLFKHHLLRNSFVGPASFNFFLDKNMTSVWSSVMSTISKPSIFNPNTYASILNTIFSGKSLFAPTMGWNSYQLAYYQTNFEQFVATDVISDVVNNGNELHQFYDSLKNPFLDYGDKEVKLFNCASEKLNDTFNFCSEYKNNFDAVLFGPPCFKFEIYEGEEQSINNYETYTEWLNKYFKTTIETCFDVMKIGAKIGFVVRDYADYFGYNYMLTHDTDKIAKEFFGDGKMYKIKLSQMKTKRSPKKLSMGNYESLFVYEKK